MCVEIENCDELQEIQLNIDIISGVEPFLGPSTFYLS
jgi:hypothetical protein